MNRFFERWLDWIYRRSQRRAWRPSWLTLPIGLPALVTTAALVWWVDQATTRYYPVSEGVVGAWLVVTPLYTLLLLACWVGRRLAVPASASLGAQRAVYAGLVWGPLAVLAVLCASEGVGRYASPLWRGAASLLVYAAGVLVVRVAGDSRGLLACAWPLRCFRCGYPLIEHGPSCPECGSPVRDSLLAVERTMGAAIPARGRRRLSKGLRIQRLLGTAEAAEDMKRCLLVSPTLPVRRLIRMLIALPVLAVVLHAAYSAFFHWMGIRIDAYDADTLPAFGSLAHRYRGGVLPAVYDLTIWSLGLWGAMAIAGRAGRVPLVSPLAWFWWGYLFTTAASFGLESVVRWPSLGYERHYWVVSGCAVSAALYWVAVWRTWRHVDARVSCS